MNYIENRKRHEIFKKVSKVVFANDFKDKKLLDLACGSFNLLSECVKAGAVYLGVEAKEENIKLFKQNNTSSYANRVEIRQDNVLNVTRKEYGEFDLIFVPGILYHLDLNDNYTLLKNVREMTKTAVVVDTVLQRENYAHLVYFEFKGFIFEGLAQQQYTQETRQEVVNERLRSVYVEDVKTNFQYVSITLTKSAMIRLLRLIGYDTIFEYKYENLFNEIPTPPIKTENLIQKTVFMNGDRDILVAYPSSEGYAEVGIFDGVTSKGRFGDLGEEGLCEVRQRMIDFCRQMQEDPQRMEKIYQMAKMLPVSLYLELCRGFIENKYDVAQLVESRIYLEDYIKYAMGAHNTNDLSEYLFSLFTYLHSVNEEDIIVSFSLSISNYFKSYLDPKLYQNLIHLAKTPSDIYCLRD